LPRAYIAGNVEIVPDEAAVDRLLAEGFDMRGTVLLPEPLPAGVESTAAAEGSVTYTSRLTDEYTLRVTTDRPALLVISENYYPSWHAEVDGAPAALLRANYTFRAVPVPAGEHEVRLYYRSERLRSSALASIVVLLILLGAASASLWRGRGATTEP
jgi:hypothetical protein